MIKQHFRIAKVHYPALRQIEKSRRRRHGGVPEGACPLQTGLAEYGLQKSAGALRYLTFIYFLRPYSERNFAFRRKKKINLATLSAIICLISYPDLPRSSHGRTEGRSGKVRFRACSVSARPEIRAFLSLRMFVLSVVILGDFAE